MDLLKDIEFTSDMLIDLMIKFRSNGYPEQLNSFGNDEILYTLDEETLNIKNSFGISRRQFEIVFLFYFSIGDNMHEMSKSMFWNKIRKLSLICRVLN